MLSSSNVGVGFGHARLVMFGVAGDHELLVRLGKEGRAWQRMHGENPPTYARGDDLKWVVLSKLKKTTTA
jgi:hypothetical protein